MSDLRIRGAREHNLRDLDLDLPHGLQIAVVGPSGSGKTSLVHDTVVREAQRRYLGGLSPKARLLLGKLGRAEVASITGLPPTIAVGHATGRGHARSTVGTRTGLLDTLRLLFARTAVDPEGAALTRSHFSFNHPDGACPACGGLGLEDRVDPELLVADASKSIRDGALRPTLPNGYTVYSQVTVDVMDRICRAHGFTVDTPWAALTEAQRDVVFYGTTALTVPFGKHSLESRMKWTGITARPREEGHYRGIVCVIEETLKRNRNANILKYVRSVACTACGGTRLARPGREARLGRWTLPGLLAVPIAELGAALDGVAVSAVWSALRPEVLHTLDRLTALGLGHLCLDRSSTGLSGGEAQRVQLAAQLGTDLGGQLIALDEPTLGLHPEAQAGMQRVFDDLRGLGNTLLLVEHDPDMVRRSDQLVALGPGAGPDGGSVVYAGPTVDGPGGGDPLGRTPAARVPRPGAGQLVLHGATLHNLRGDTFPLRLGALNVVMGPSGAGKSSLVLGTLLPALRGERGGPHAGLDGVPAGLRVQAVDASPIGRTPRSTPATWTGLFDLARKRFAATPEAKALGFRATRFSFNTKAGRCPTCEGLGVERVGLHLLEDIERPCPACGGGRYAEAVLAVRLRGRTIAEVLGMPAAEALGFFADDPPIAAMLQAMVDLGIGHLSLGQSSTTLSRGEAQRVKLSALLGKSAGGPSLVLMDEPDRGLHPEDVGRLLRALDGLVHAGHTVLAISHHRHLWAAADHLVEVRDGRVHVAEAPSAGPLSQVQPPRSPAMRPDAITLRGVRTHNLQGVDVRIPHGRLTAVVGPSGSGKSSLVFDTLAAEAWARVSEGLPFAVRRHMRRLPRPDLDAAAGLTPVLALAQRAGRAGARSTVATQSGVGLMLRLLWARAGRVDGRPAGLLAAQLSPDRVEGACPACDGRGTVPRCDPGRLVTHPERSLRDGAMAGTKPGRFLGEPDGQHLATLAAVLGEGALDRPWRGLTEEERAVALHGAGDRVVSVRWRYQRGKRAGEHAFEGSWDGLCALVEREARLRASRKEAPAWQALLVDAACGACGGERLNEAARAVSLGGLRLPEALALPLSALLERVPALDLDDAQRAVLAAVWPDARDRLTALADVGLGHLQLGRRTATLSDGELQRVRLAAVSHAGLTGLTVVLDEPCAGLDAAAAAGLVARLRAVRDAGNTVVVVAHRAALIRSADHLVELGPGAGTEGGRVLEAGPAAEVLAGEGPTARALRAPVVRASAAVGATALRIRGATLHNLADLDLDLPASGLVAVTGPSGAGKTSLVHGVIGESRRAGAPVGCRSIAGLDRFAAVRGRGPSGQTVLDALSLLPALQRAFHGAAAGSGLGRGAFSFRSPAGRCPACKGSGVESISMDALADLHLPCPACGGARYRPEVLAARWAGLRIDEVLALPAAALHVRLPEGALRGGVAPLLEAGLGHLALGRATRTLSGGELQRLGLAARLQETDGPVLHLLDEPGRGLHEGDLQRLLRLFARLVARGDLLIASVHRERLRCAADVEVSLGPGAGAEGGRRVHLGPPRP